MKIYKLECLTEDGTIEENGYFISLEKAKIKKKYLDGDKHNQRYGIEQNIVEIETED